MKSPLPESVVLTDITRSKERRKFLKTNFTFTEIKFSKTLEKCKESE